MSDTPSLAARRLARIARRARTLALFYFVVLFAATHVPAPPSSVVSVNDKLLHFGGYAVLTICVLVCWELTIGYLEPKHYFAVWLVGILYGAVDEITQVPVRRTCDVNDWIADVLGVVCGLLVYRLARAAWQRIAGGGPFPLSKT